MIKGMVIFFLFLGDGITLSFLALWRTW